jgi:hypothetical protein
VKKYLENIWVKIGLVQVVLGEGSLWPIVVLAAHLA